LGIRKRKHKVSMASQDDAMPAKSSRDPAKCPGTCCLISSKAHRVSASRPPANYKKHTKICESASLMKKIVIFLIVAANKLFAFYRVDGHFIWKLELVRMIHLIV